LAAVTQTSPTHFAHLFKQATGQTPHQYVIRCRMERAKHLLTGTTFPLHEIGAPVGYADPSHFPALFPRYVATTPKAKPDAPARGGVQRRTTGSPLGRTRQSRREPPGTRRRLRACWGVCPFHGTIFARFEHVSHECHRGRGTPVLQFSWCMQAQGSRMARGEGGGGMTHSFMGGETISTQAAAQHEQAAEQYGHAARHYQEAAEHYKRGQYAKAAHDVQTARGHHAQATAHAATAAKYHAEAYVNNSHFIDHNGPD